MLFLWAHRRFLSQNIHRQVKDLLQEQKYKQIVKLLEEKKYSPDRFLKDSYIKALVLSQNRNLSEKLHIAAHEDAKKQDINHSSEYHGINPSYQDFGTQQPPKEELLKEGKPYYMHADLNEWGRDLKKGKPIRVIVQEAFSWSKLAQQFGSRLFFGVLIMTGLSVLLEQQGVLKTGMGGEIQPEKTSNVVTFDDVQGVDEAKEELEEVVQFLKEPGKFMELGGRLPKGVLLYGPPGTGKTYLAKAVAGEAGVPFFQMSGSEFDELYVGVGAKRVRELFLAAKKRAPCIVFIDELDAVGSKRSNKDQSYMRQTLNQLLVEMDGFESSTGVILIAATNTPDSLDKALVRPGRFDKLVPVPLPDVKGRTDILKVHMKGVAFANNVNPDKIARGTPGFSGADLANLVNQAAIKASKDSSMFVTESDLDWAKDKILMGSERKSAVITEESKLMTAYHEGGHTLVSIFTDGAMPLHKVTVMPRGNALGVTMMLPEGDELSISRKQLLARIDVSMGGRVAEELIYGDDNVSTGASSDLQNCTKVARGMVLHYGMCESAGMVTYSEEEFARAGAATKAKIEDEIKQILKVSKIKKDSHARVTKLLKAKEKELHKLAKALVEKETMAVDEVKALVKQ